MTMFLAFLGVGLVILAIVTSISGFVPKQGRSIEADGEEIIATIINSNNTAEKAVIIRAADESGRKYAAKLKPTEAKMWLKGDKIRIVLSGDKKKYRILFHEYFKENEERMREAALRLLEKTAKPNSISARMTDFTKESLEALHASEADSHTFLILATYMRAINRYFVVGVIASILCAIWCIEARLQMFQLLIPVVIIVSLFLSVSSTAKACTVLYNKAVKKS